MLRTWTRAAAMSAALLTVAGCGGSTTTTGPSASAPHATRQVAMSAAAPTVAAPDATTVVNRVCMVLQQRAPLAIAAPFSATAVRRHLRDAAPAAKSLETSLHRLGDQQPSATRRLTSLAEQVRRLRRAYTAATAQLHMPHGADAAGQSIAAREALLDDAARRSGFPACTVG